MEAGLILNFEKKKQEEKIYKKKFAKIDKPFACGLESINLQGLTNDSIELEASY
jgi:hypothetical protein